MRSEKKCIDRPPLPHSCTGCIISITSQSQFRAIVESSKRSSLRVRPRTRVCACLRTESRALLPRYVTACVTAAGLRNALEIRAGGLTFPPRLETSWSVRQKSKHYGRFSRGYISSELGTLGLEDNALTNEPPDLTNPEAISQVFRTSVTSRCGRVREIYISAMRQRLSGTLSKRGVDGSDLWTRITQLGAFCNRDGYATSRRNAG
ncbi:hypothetical protein EVAR_50799_1 [Eumeta japonica]|uniref:Uncharacterized protein n=1 Tax=Eumeta variegata TaxID=151549 RepID=A0A4C1XC04_EUMVA|nr:hypothetical protein EVAR_50799_1 [Eumeta japonica]